MCFATAAQARGCISSASLQQECPACYAASAHAVCTSDGMVGVVSDHWGILLPVLGRVVGVTAAIRLFLFQTNGGPNAHLRVLPSSCGGGQLRLWCASFAAFARLALHALCCLHKALGTV